MNELRMWLFSLISACLLRSLLPELLPEGTAKTLVRFLCGIAVTLTLLSPLDSARFELPEDIPYFREEAAFAAEEGEALARESQVAVIKSACEAYILDKGDLEDSGILLELDIHPEPPHVPVSARIRGTLSPEEKQTLQRILTEDFSIPKEAQTWMP